MTEPITIDELKLAGFRAYLKPQTFKLYSRKNGPLSLAVFAPNGKGKSSMVDALEYYFRKDGSLKRLGKRSTANKAGMGAVRHVDAERLGVETSVSVQFRQGNDEFGGPRMFSSPLTDSAKRVLSHVRVSFVIRGYELRRFVDDTSPVARYGNFVDWLDLRPLLKVQENMEDLKRRVEKEVVYQREDYMLRDLADITDDAIREWDEPVILEWLNESILAPLDTSIKFKTLSDKDLALHKLESRKRAELDHARLVKQGKLLDEIDILHGRRDTLLGPAGKIHSFERSVLAFKNAADKESAVESVTREYVFGEVWKSAKKLLGGDSKLDRCPVCDTEFANSPRGSRDDVYANLRFNLNGLKRYHTVKAAKERAEKDLVQAKRELEESLDKLPLSPNLMLEYNTVNAVYTYRQALGSWKVGEGAPDSGAAIQKLENMRASIISEIGWVSRRRGGITYSNAHEKVRRLLCVKAERKRIRRTKHELRGIRDSLGRQIKAFDTAIVRHIRGLVGRLADEAGAIYKGIQGPGAKAPRIQIKLAEEGNARQRSARLLIDFAGRKSVAPSGYLSDSQVHTLALAVRLAAIRMFNAGFRVMALDDIVTSYDADHRKNIAAVLNDRFDKLQIILVTHDRQFYDMLRDHLDEKRWAFKRIKELQAGFGPILVDHWTRDEDIEAKIEAGKDAANDIRQAEEKWLYSICRDFAVPTTFGRNKDLRMSEMAQLLGKFLEKCGLELPAISGRSKPFLQSLQRAKIENMGSHYRNDTYASLSGGDTRARWEEFKRFRDMFKCPKCCHPRFKRPLRCKKPVCRNCGTTFSFGQETPT